jgi:hypothetical protein
MRFFAYRKSEWFAHFEKLNNAKPSHSDVDNWISQLSEYEYSSMRAAASAFIEDAAKERLKDYFQ